MPGARVTMTLTAVDGCPVHKEGDQIAFEPPALVMPAGGQVCVHAVAAALPYLLALAHGTEAAALGLPESAQVRSSHGCTWTLERGLPKKEATLTVALTRETRDVEFIIRHLKGIPLFAPLPMPSVRTLIEYIRLEKFPERTAIIKQGEPGTHLFVLIKGEVSVIKIDAQGRENILARLRKGDVFGEMSLITGEPCSASIRTLTPISALTIAKDDFARLLEGHPSLNIYFNKLLAQRLRKTMAHVEEEIAKGVLGKLSMISLPELTQTISTNGRSGVLRLYRGSETGEIYFINGAVVDASMGAEAGEEVFYRFLGWSEGDFRFVPGEEPQARRIKGDTMGLLMEGLRRQDESQRQAAANGAPAVATA